LKDHEREKPFSRQGRRALLFVPVRRRQGKGDPADQSEKSRDDEDQDVNPEPCGDCFSFREPDQ
jgi:hypothetical protein